MHVAVGLSEHPDMVAEAHESIRTVTRDPLTRLLLGHSQLTQTQLETLLADSLSNDAQRGRRRLFRPSGARISRGAYNRSLIQAQNNVIRSLYTVLLLGYVGLFDSASLQPFIELSDTIQGYVDEIRKPGQNHRLGLQQLNQRLLESIIALAKRQSFKDTL
jgi:hypothetical protein